MVAFSVPENLAFDTYDALIEAIGDWMDRSDLTGSAPAMIALAESRMDRELSPYFEESTASLVWSDGVASLPNDFGAAVRVYTGTMPLPQIAPAQGLMIPAGTTPQAFSVEGSGIRCWPECEATGTLLYRTRLDRLSAANANTTLLSRHPDLYFYGAMLFAEGYVANDSRASLFKALWDEAIASAKMYLTRQKMAGPMVPMPQWVP